MKVLQLVSLFEAAERGLHRHFEVIDAASWSARPADAIDETVFGIATRAAGPVDKTLMDRLPSLKVIACFGAATDYVDAVEAGRREIRITNTSLALADDVADFAIAHMLALTRGVLTGHAHVTNGTWMTSPPRLSRSLTGRNLGIVGLGTVGTQIADRAGALKMQIGYHNRRPAAGTGARYFDSVAGLATWADVLILSCPGGRETKGIVNETVLEALGPMGFLVNVSRGSVVSQEALFQALKSGRIAGAALDVFETEPFAPTIDLHLPNLLLTPHAASSTEEGRQRMSDLMVQSIVDVARQVKSRV